MGKKCLLKSLILTCLCLVQTSVRKAFANEPPLSNIPCEGPLQTPNILQESEELIQQLRNIHEGTIAPETFPQTPADRIVNFYVSPRKGSYHLAEGRIKKIIKNEAGEFVIIFLPLNPIGPNETEIKLPFSTIKLEQAHLKKILTAPQIEFIKTQITQALQTGQAIQYVEQFSFPHIVSGRITHLNYENSGNLKSFHIMKKNGEEREHSFIPPYLHIDPVSIKLFNVEARPLDEKETALLNQMRAAAGEHRYISFRVQQANKSYIYEGWAHSVVLDAEGIYIFKVSTDTPLSDWGETFPITSISKDSFISRPELKLKTPVETIQPQPFKAQIDEAVLENLLNNHSVKFTKPLAEPWSTLLKKLSIFADNQEVSGPQIPSELEQIVNPGLELRLYISNGSNGRIRLTLRRNRAGIWSFGSTAFDRTVITEDFRDQNIRYTSNEKFQLDEGGDLALPARILREQMRLIRYMLLANTLPLQYSETITHWSRVIPEDINKPDTLALLTAHKKQQYFLDRGFVSAPSVILSLVQSQVLTAIDYLLKNNMQFWSYNAGASGIKRGIYPLTGPLSKNPEHMWASGYVFEDALILSMHEAGLEFNGNQWAPKTVEGTP